MFVSIVLDDTWYICNNDEFFFLKKWQQMKKTEKVKK